MGKERCQLRLQEIPPEKKKGGSSQIQDNEEPSENHDIKVACNAISEGKKE